VCCISLSYRYSLFRHIKGDETDSTSKDAIADHAAAGDLVAVSRRLDVLATALAPDALEQGPEGDEQDALDQPRRHSMPRGGT